jgi:hypothetical protein
VIESNKIGDHLGSAAARETQAAFRLDRQPHRAEPLGLAAQPLDPASQGCFLALRVRLCSRRSQVRGAGAPVVRTATHDHATMVLAGFDPYVDPLPGCVQVPKCTCQCACPEYKWGPSNRGDPGSIPGASTTHRIGNGPQ